MLPAPLSLRDAEARDIPTLLQLEEDGMRDYAVALWGYWRPSAPAETFDVAGHQMVLSGTETFGCIAMGWTPTHLALRKLYLAPKARNQGIGTHLLEHIWSVAQTRALPIRLRVLTTNPALRFYQRAGYDIESETSEHRYLVRTG